ncbi:MAG: class I SAM-dependent methyltransferase [Chloroflexota bacterium]|nr:class I SAM-dependent methyltransferase [Chloroflexota bacterium]
MENIQSQLKSIARAVQYRQPLLAQQQALRLYNGFYEGYPGLVLDRYGSALIILDHGLPNDAEALCKELAQWALTQDFGIESVLLKQRGAEDEDRKNGLLIAGEKLPDRVKEWDVQYALDLKINQDASFYLDTRNLRRWLLDHGAGKRVLNTFAYTGSLGVAAGMGGANLVVQTDLSDKFMQLSQISWELNELMSKKQQIRPGDFFRVAGRMRNSERLFDVVILDPPFFSTTSAGRVDQQGETTRLINKVRPLVAHGGKLIAINNALFLPGAASIAELEALCRSDYLSLGEIIPVPEDITGYPETIVDIPPADPAPFNHPTKIAVLNVTRKDKRK